MYSDPLAPHGHALRDYFEGDTSATIVVHSDLGEHDEIPIGIFFREPENFFPFEKVALEHCRGRVLDVGAGTGVHSLYLQEKGLSVCAVEVIPEAAEIMRQRGVKEVVQGSVFELEAGHFDTVLMMMNGVGIVGTLEGLDDYFRQVPRLLAPGGQLLLDSGAPTIREESAGAATRGGYLGEAWVELEYKGEKGPPFRELYVDSETLGDHATRAGWLCELVYEGDENSYLARLTRAADRSD